MNKRIPFLFVIVAFLLMGNAALAQLKQGNKRYEALAYNEAIPFYKVAVLQDSTNVEAWTKMGDCYRLISDFEGAENAYGHAVATGSASPQTMLNYAEALMSVGKYDAAKKQLQKCKNVSPADARIDQLLSGLDNLSAFGAEKAAVKVKKVDFNTGAGEFCPTIFNGGLVFTSNRPSLRWIGSKHAWTDKDYYSLYYAKGKEASFGTVEMFAPNLSTKFHNGPIAINASGTQMFYTSNNVNGGERSTDEKGITRMKIFTAKWDNGQFIGDLPLPFNNDRYTVQHPSISYDGKTLYFCSDMPGGKGGMDIWKSTFEGNSWGKPENLGDNVNTSGNESFPFITKDGQLYFASNSWGGLGGMDIFVVNVNGGGKPKNLGEPINSRYDDFGVAINPDGMTGYFSSNREGSRDNDDIYYFKKSCVMTKVTVEDKKTGQPLANAEVKVIENGKERETLFTDSTGTFERCLIPTGTYEFRALKDLYNENTTRVTGNDLIADTTGFTTKIPLAHTQVDLSGRVFTADEKLPLSNKKVVLKNVTRNTQVEGMTDDNGNYNFKDLERECFYEVYVANENCTEAKEKTSTVGVRGDKQLTLDVPMYCKGAVIKIDNIYYDYNKSDIRPDAAKELDKVVALMEKYPNMKIELGSHTDARGDDGYNLKLSDRRAKAAVQYIVSKGIDAKRLKAKGYGEKVLLNKCANDVECTDAEHEQNRRTEFTILSVK